MTRRGENSIILKSQYHAGMMELADMRDLGSRAAMRWGSSPHARTSVGAKSVRLRFRQQPTAIAENCAHFLAPPSKSEALGFGFVFSFASYVSLATAFFRSEQTPSRTHSAAPPFQIEPTSLGFNLGFFFLGQSPFGFVSGNSLRLLPKTALTSLPLLPNPKHLASDLFFRFFSLICRWISSQ